jgi:hypothetical protein
VAVLAGHPRGLAGDVGKQRLNIAPPSKVESLLWPALLGKALAGLTRQPLGERALDVELAVPGVPSEFLGGLHHGLVHRLVAGLHLLRGAHLGRRLVLVLMLLVSELVLMGMLGVLGMRQVLLHLLQLLLDGLGHGAPRAAGAAVGEDAGGGEVNVGHAGRVAVIVVHVGLWLCLAVGVLGEVRVHGGSSSGRGGIVLGTHPHVVKDGGGICLEMVVQLVSVDVSVRVSVSVSVSVGVVGVDDVLWIVGSQMMMCCHLARGAAAWRRARLRHLVWSPALRADDGRFHARTRNGISRNVARRGSG